MTTRVDLNLYIPLFILVKTDTKNDEDDAKDNM